MTMLSELVPLYPASFPITMLPILTFSEIPPVEMVLIDRPGQPFLGAGEASQGPTGAALANAVFDATGVRFRTLPLTPDRVLQAL